MVKKILIVAVILAAVAAIAFMYFKITRTNDTYTPSIEGIPGSYEFLMEVNPGAYHEQEMSLLIALSEGGNEFGDISMNPLKQWPALVEELMNLRSYQPSWQAVLNKNMIVFASSSQLTSESWIMSIGLKAETSAGAVEEMMFAWKSEKGFSRRDFKGTTILSTDKIHYCVQHNCLLVSPTLSAIEDAILQHQKDNRLFGKPEFASAYHVRSADNFINFFTGNGSLNWVQLNPTAQNQSWLLSGYLLDNDSLDNTLQLCEHGTAPHIQDVLPATTSFLDAYSYSDFATGWAMQEEFSASNYARSVKFWGQAWKDFGDSCQCDLNEMMLNWRGGEWGIAVTTNSDSTTSRALYFGVKDSTDVIALMKPILGAVQNTTAYELKYPALFDRNKPTSVLVESNYICQKGLYVFVASTPLDLQRVTDATSPLSALPEFSRTWGQTLKNSGRYIYQSGQLLSPLTSGITSMLSGLNGYTISTEPFKENKTLVHISLPLQADEKKKREEEEITENTPADDIAEDALRGPWEVINHNTRGTERIYQNKQKQLCLIGEDGKLLWSYPLESEIIGPVSQIDALKNGKLQYAFAAGNRVHVVDRTGKSLQSFPVSLGALASSPLFVFDYDNTKAYRMIVGSEDGALHNHNAQGKMNEGWKYSGNAPIALVKHVKVGTDDLLVAITHAGSVRLLKRNGEIKQETELVLEDWDKKDVEIRALSTLKDLKITYQTNHGETKSVGI